MTLAAIGPMIYDWVRGAFDAVGLPMWTFNLLVAVLKAALVITFVLINVLYLVWLERKISARIQQRMGPMVVGPRGLLQTLADALKLLFKEDIIPSAADRFTFILAPIMAVVPAVMIFAVVPFGDGWTASSLNIGMLYVAAVSSVMIPSFLMAGWGSNNKWSVFGAMRSAAQLVSYEVPLALAVVSVVILAGTLNLDGIIEAQRNSVWFILLQPLGFLIYYTASLAELNRGPFDLIEAEQELVAGYNVEYSGMRWSMFFLAEYANLFSASAIAATLYLGGWSGPWLPPFVWFLLKTYLFVFLAMWIRWTFPRIRVDQLMHFGWKVLLPLSLVNVALTGAYAVLR